MEQCFEQNQSIGLTITVEAQEKIRDNFQLTGRRVVDIHYFLSSLKNLRHEGFDCSFFDIEIVSEKRFGLKSVFVTKCRVCTKRESISTQDESNVDVNKAAICGALAIGIGYSQFTEMCSSLDIPSMSSNTYNSYENSLSPLIKENSFESIIEAGKKEKQLAIEAGDVDIDGVPYISVIVDGAWCKRSYKTNYAASSGVAAIIGVKTKQILYVGIKNKYCQYCEKYVRSKKDIPEHKCYKNWDGTSTAMEAQVILDGFSCSVEMHGLKYKQLIGDGDSSVYNKIKNNKPYGPNFFIEKIECRNHILRNYCNKIKEYSKCVKLDPKIRCLFRHVLRFRTAIVSAIRYRKAEDNPTYKKISNLKDDILNGPKHIFGFHEKCKSYYCQGSKPNEENLWTIFVKNELFTDFNKHLSRVVNNSSSLLHDVDTNVAECYNSIVNKLAGGKRVHFSKKGSYQNRCLAAVANFNNKHPFFYELQKKIINKNQVGTYTEKFCLKSKVIRKKCLRKKKFFFEADTDYGQELAEDKSAEEFEKLKKDFLNAINNTDIVAVELNTRGQSTNPKWLEERNCRLTSSNFGKICKLRPTTSTAATVKALLYSTNIKRSFAIQHGILQEATARERFQDLCNLEVKECGMFIHSNYKFLAASPDGLIGDNLILEIKCPYVARNMKIIDAVENRTIDYCYIENSKVKLKSNHNYMFQIQGLLEITGRQFCYFFIYTFKDCTYEIIVRDKQFWNDQVIGKLEKFYYSAYLPELLDSRFNRNLNIRDIRCKDL
ncbi:hypothetical protein FQR65_LT11118 [Abscondita terminalis]|nr:hypothetical protein FQR65_LT11118 [Abscondita terminalis]